MRGNIILKPSRREAGYMQKQILGSASQVKEMHTPQYCNMILSESSILERLDFDYWLDCIRDKVSPTFFRMFTAVITYLRSLYLSTGVTDWALFTVNFALQLISDDVLVHMHQSAEDFGRKLYKTHFSKPKVISESLEFVSHSCRNLRTALSSSLVHAIKNIILTVAAMGYIPGAHLPNVHKLFGRSSARTGIDLIEDLIESLHSLFNNAAIFQQTGSVSDLLLGKDVHSQLLTEIHWLIDFEKLTFQGMSDGLRVADDEYEARLCKCATSLDTYLKTGVLSKMQRVEMVPFVARLKEIMIRRNDSGSCTRPMPIAIMLVGPPGVGKSNIVTYVAKTYCAVTGRTYRREMIYDVNTGDEFMSGYKGVQHPIIHIGEPANLAPNIAAKTGDASLNLLLNMIDTNHFLANMADLSQKGMVAVCPRMVLMDGNNEELNAKLSLAAPTALFRRILFVRCAAKPEFRKAGSVEMDFEKCKLSSLPPMDRYLFTLVRKEAITNVAHTDRIILQDTDIYGLTDYLENMFIEETRKYDEVKALFDGEDVNKYRSSQKKLVPQSLILGMKNQGKSFLKNVVTKCESLKQNILMKMGFLSFIMATIHHFGFMLDYYYYFRLVYYPGVVTNLLTYGIVYIMNSLLSSFIFPLGIVGVIAYIGLNMVYMWQMIYKVKEFYAFWRNPTPYAANKLYSKITTLEIAAGIAVVYMVWKITRPTIEAVSEGTTISKLESDVGAGRLPPKKKSDFQWKEISPMSPLIKSSHTGNKPAEVMATILANVRVIEVNATGSDVVAKQYITGVYGDVAFINTHTLVDLPSATTWDFAVSLVNDPTSIRRGIIEKDMVRQVHGDLSVIRLPGVCFRDIRPYLGSARLPPYGEKVVVRGVQSIAMSQSPLGVSRDTMSPPVVFDHLCSYDWPEAGNGDCGTPIIAFSDSGTYLLAIHSARLSDGTRRYGTMVQNLPSVNLPLGCLAPVFSEGELKIPDGCVLVPSAHVKSGINHVRTPGLDFLGAVLGRRDTPGKSAVIHSPLFNYSHDLLGISPFDENGEELYGPPPMGHIWREENGEKNYYHPYNHFLSSIGKVKGVVDPILLRKAIEIAEDFIDSQSPPALWRPIPLEYALNGDSENVYWRQINLSTGAGFEYRCSKRVLVTPVELAWKENGVQLVDKVIHNVERLIECYSKEQLGMEILTAQLKDEVRSARKNAQAKTRVFCAGSFSNLILSRMFLGPLFSDMIERGHAYGCAIGMNCHSVDAHILATELQSFSSLMMEGDYEGYDSEMIFIISLAVNTLIERQCQKHGYNDAAMKVVRGINSDSVYPVVVVDDAIVQAGITPSGEYGTAERNCLRNLLLIIVGYLKTASTMGDGPFDPMNFKKYVLPRTYGDDVANAIKPTISKFYNNLTYAKFIASTGMKYTSASKTKELEKFVPFNELTFLKRHFVFRRDLHRWVMPLSMESIMKSICYILPSRSIPLTEQVIQTCVSAMRELFFHWEIDHYMRQRDVMISVLSITLERPVEILAKFFPMFEELQEELFGDDILPPDGMGSIQAPPLQGYCIDPLTPF